jgi:DNA-binding MarR family transcriptional regulator
MLSSGAMTARLDRLETAGLIRRLADPNDRRGTIIEPTQLGIAMWDKAVGTQARRERMLSQVLTKAERERLEDLLRALMAAFPDWKEKKHAVHAAADAEVAEDQV